MITTIPKFRSLCIALIGLCLVLRPLAASEHHGIVKFGGLPLPGATVTASQGDKKFTAVADTAGAYAFPDLPDGVWTIQVEMLCFTTLTKEVAVAPDAPSPEWEMKLQTLEEMKTTAAPAAPATPAAAAAPASTASANSGQAQTAAAAVPSGKKGKGKAAAVPQQTGSFQRAEVNASGNGANPAPADNIAPADASGASEAMVVNGSVGNGIERRAIGNARKGPGSLFRGALVGIIDNSALDARQFSLTGLDTPQPAYNHLRLGGSLGGPLIIPHLLHGNGQFFVNYMMTRNRNASNYPTLVPTEAERNGDFSQVLNRLGEPAVLIDPLNGKPLPGNVIPASRISPQALALLRFYPLPNFVQTAGYNYQVALVSPQSADDLNTHLNKTLSRKDFLDGGFSYHNGRGVNPNIFGFNDNSDIAGLNGNVNWRHMFNQRVNSTFGIQYSRYSMSTLPFFANKENISGEAGINGNNQEPANYGPPNLTFASGIASLNDAQQSLFRAQTIGFTYTGLWVRRPHNITYGVDIRRQQFNYLSQQNARGNFGFNGTLAGNDFAGFLLGYPDTSTIAFGNADKYFRANMDDAYITDDWRVAAGFTLNIGLRWEYGSPIVEKYGRLVNLDIAPGFTGVAPVIGNSPTGSLTGTKYPDSLIHPDKHAFQPRIAFSWHPLFGSTVVVRGGYGVYYNTSVYQVIANQMAQQSPLSKSLSVSNQLLNPFSMANGFNAPPGTTANTFAIDPNFRVGYSQNWQISVQRDLTEGIVMTATYLGIKGTRAVQVSLPQTYPLNVENPCKSCPSGYAYMSSNGNSTRQSAQLQIVRRFHNGISANAQYTFSKAIDDAALGGRGQGGSVIAQNWLDLSAERGLSNFDQRHLVTVSAQYTSGVGVRGGTLMSGWRGTLLKGWTFVNQITAGSGLPETPIYQAAVANTGVAGPIRPDYSGAALYDAPPGYFLNPAAFTAPNGHWGTAGRDIIAGPSQFYMNSSMARTFKENIDLRFDATNTLNHVVYPSYNTVINSPQFGLPNQPGVSGQSGQVGQQPNQGPQNGGMRVLQVTLRWRF